MIAGETVGRTIRAAAGILILVLPACIPMRLTVRRPYSGVVVDAATGRSISGATVIVESWGVESPPGYSHHRRFKSAFVTKTDADGRWQVPEKSEWGMGIPAPDGVPLFVDTFCVRAPTYAPAGVNPWQEEPTGSPPRWESLWNAGPPDRIQLGAVQTGAGTAQIETEETTACGIRREPRPPLAR